MMPSDDELLDSVAALALGILPADEARSLRLRIALDERLLAEYRSLRMAADLVGYSAESSGVDAAICVPLKARVMDAVRAQAPARIPRARPLLVWPAWAAAAAALAFALATMLQNATLHADVKSSHDRAAQLQTRIDAETRVAAAQRGELADLYAPDGKHFSVQGGEIVQRGDRIYIAMRQLPKLPKGKVYQAWTLAQGAKAVAPSVTFTPDRAGSAIVALPVSTARIAAVAVSVEPEGGSKAPTSTPNFIRKLG